MSRAASGELAEEESSLYSALPLLRSTIKSHIPGPGLSPALSLYDSIVLKSVAIVLGVSLIVITKPYTFLLIVRKRKGS